MPRGIPGYRWNRNGPGVYGLRNSEMRYLAWVKSTGDPNIWIYHGNFGINFQGEAGSAMEARHTCNKILKEMGRLNRGTPAT